MKYLLFASLILIAFSAPAQDSSSVVVHKDPRLDVLLKKQGDVNAAIKKANSHTAKGYRLLVINTNNREEAISAKTKVYQLYPELKAYLLYQAPYVRLRVGNFTDKDEAEDYRKSLSKEFPNSVFLVRDTVEVKLSDLNQ